MIIFHPSWSNFYKKLIKQIDIKAKYSLTSRNLGKYYIRVANLKALSQSVKQLKLPILTRKWNRL